jgi:glucan 1,3-beta-glucosidase
VSIFNSDSFQLYSGISYTIKNDTAEPWLHLTEPPKSNGTHESKNCAAISPTNPSTYWYESITHNGESSFMDSSYKANYQVFRNVVTDYGADNTGASDASGAIQNAINGKLEPEPFSVTPSNNY